MAIRHLQMGAAAAKTVASTGGGAESSPPPENESGYYVYGNNFANFAYTERDASILSDQADRNYMCNQNIYTFPSGIRKVGYDDHLSTIYLITSGNDLYAIGQFFRGERTCCKVYNDFTYVTGNVLDAVVVQEGTYIIDTGNALHSCALVDGNDALQQVIPTGYSAAGLVSFHKATGDLHMNGSGIGEDWEYIFPQSRNYGTKTLFAAKTNGNIYQLYRNPFSYQKGSNFSGKYAVGYEGLLAKMNDGNWYAYGSEKLYNRNGTNVYSNRLGTATGTTSSFLNPLTPSTYINNVSEDFVKASIGSRQSAFLTDDKKLYVVGYNSYSAIGYTGDIGLYITTPTFLYSGIDDVNLLPRDKYQNVNDGPDTSMIFISGGNMYGQGPLKLGLYHFPPNDLTNLKYAVDDPNKSFPVTDLIFDKPALIETGNWKYCYHALNDNRCYHRIAWNDTEIGIGVNQESYITNKLLYNGIYNDATFIAGVGADIFSGVRRQSFKNRTYNCYLSGNECYVWGFPFGFENNGNHNQSLIFYPPDSGNYYIKPDTTSPKLHTFLPQKISGNWDKAYLGDDGILLTINDSGYYMGNNREQMMGNLNSPSLYISYESGINSTVEIEHVDANSDYIYPPQYIGYKIKDAYMNGLGYSVILTTDNKVYSCGDADKTYRLGLGDTNNRGSYTNISQLNNAGIVKLEGYDKGVFALASNGDLYAWGKYAYNVSVGQTPVNITGNVKDIQLMGTCTDYIRYVSAFLITNNNELYSCSVGDFTYTNTFGELLLGDTTPRSTFTKVGADSDWEQVAPIYVYYEVGGDVSTAEKRVKGFIILLRKTDNSIYVASNIADLDIVSDGSDFSVDHYLGSSSYPAFEPLDPTTEIRQLSGIYASNIISSADGFILVPTG